MSSTAGIALRIELDGVERRVEVDGSTLIGREPDCDLVLVDPSVSRHHARLSHGDTGWTITDLGSANGTFVNDERVQCRLLSDGDRIRFGELRVECALFDSPRRAVSRKRTHDSRGAAEKLGEGMPSSARPVGSLDDLLDAVLAPPFDSAQPAVGPTGSSTPSGAIRLVRLLKDATETLLDEGGPEAMLERVIDLALEHLPAERGFLQLWDQPSGKLVPMIERPTQGKTNPARISSHIVRLVVEGRQAIRIEEPANDDRFQTAHSLRGIRSALCVPLEHGGRLAGLIYLDRRTSGGFAETDLDVLAILAKLSASAIERGRLQASLAREQRIRTRLERYHAPAVIDHIVKRGDSVAGQMLAEERIVTVLFCDLVGFTRMAESMEPNQVALMLSEVFEALTEEIFRFGGTLDKFMGDSVMAFFGAPIEQPDHAERAVHAAIAMQRCIQSLDADRPLLCGLQLRVGVNTGPVVVGDIGALRHRDYTVIGDTVNVASRLESAVASGGQIVVGPETRARLGATIRASALEPVPLRNREEPLQAFLIPYDDA